MSLPISSYADTSIQGVKGGDAAEMESRLNALVQEAGLPDDANDMIVTGVGQGPEWQALVLFGSASPSVPRAQVRFAAAEDPDASGALTKLLARIDQINADEPSGLNALGKIEIAGNGRGDKVMAVALLATN